METNCIRLGLLKTTTVNFPGHLAAAVFLPGCNLRCPYCYNAELACADVYGAALKSEANDYVSLDEVFRHLEKRRGILKALAISGGEPLLSPALPALLEKANALQYTVKLDTNGLLPEKLKTLLRDKTPPISMVALDLKTAPNRYGELFAVHEASLTAEEKLRKTIAILEEAQSRGLNVEYRTVLIPGLVGKAEIEAIGSLLPKNADWEFARFLPGTCLKDEWNSISPYTESETDELVKLAQTFVRNIHVR